VVHAEGRGYQTRITVLLFAYMEEQPAGLDVRAHDRSRF
jgi:hypothetical protein